MHDRQPTLRSLLAAAGRLAARAGHRAASFGLLAAAAFLLHPVAPARAAEAQATEAASTQAASTQAASTQAASTEAEALLRRVEARHSALDSMSAGFTQAYRSVATAQELVERGRLFVKRPLLRFDYRKPSKKVFVVEADGTTLGYVPADRSAVKARIPADAPHLRLLRGDHGLLEDFSVQTVTLKEPLVAGSVQLKLTPRRVLHDVDLVYLEVDADSGAIHRVLVFDSIGNQSDLLLDRVKENPPLSDSEFRLELPRGVELRDLTKEQQP